MPGDLVGLVDSLSGARRAHCYSRTFIHSCIKQTGHTRGQGAQGEGIVLNTLGLLWCNNFSFKVCTCAEVINDSARDEIRSCVIIACAQGESQLTILESWFTIADLHFASSSLSLVIGDANQFWLVVQSDTHYNPRVRMLIISCGVGNGGFAISVVRMKLKNNNPHEMAKLRHI